MAAPSVSKRWKTESCPAIFPSHEGAAPPIYIRSFIHPFISHYLFIELTYHVPDTGSGAQKEGKRGPPRGAAGLVPWNACQARSGTQPSRQTRGNITFTSPFPFPFFD